MSAKGGPLELLGSMLSAMAPVRGSVKLESCIITGELVALPDRRFADGSVPYAPRFHQAEFQLSLGHAGTGEVGTRLGPRLVVPLALAPARCRGGWPLPR